MNPRLGKMLFLGKKYDTYMAGDHRCWIWGLRLTCKSLTESSVPTMNFENSKFILCLKEQSINQPNFKNYTLAWKHKGNGTGDNESYRRNSLGYMISVGTWRKYYLQLLFVITWFWYGCFPYYQIFSRCSFFIVFKKADISTKLLLLLLILTWKGVRSIGTLSCIQIRNTFNRYHSVILY